ncbi:cytoplasmic tRNA 2-thiolation protein 1-like isoform X3 [Equus asinus]|uniref:cytoplasmic tRNA 2-thiolation protein 1-like isoform X3 n=1 Tax=Equus asinus TaxID=9793 RepID=UPI0038F6D90F
MPAPQCATCHKARAALRRPRSGRALCGACFCAAFEAEVLHTVVAGRLLPPGAVVAVGASGGKDSTVLAHVLQVLAPRLGISLRLVAVDEGIGGYRDAALAAVRRQAARWELPLTVVAYADLFGGWTMDAVARSTAGSGRSRACCTFCGVLRRRALEEGARLAGATHIVTAVLTGVSPVLRITWLQTVATHGPLFSVGKSWKGETGGQEATEETVGIVQEGDRSLGEDSSLGDGDQQYPRQFIPNTPALVEI